jgi:NTP pyrophosphatase (non-canonical NTP hydrolase)
MSNVKQYGLERLEEMTLEWSHDKGILTNGKAITQCLKLMSELGELADNLAKGNCIKDDVGDCLVVLTNISALQGTSLSECWSHAWDDIKDRQGFLNAEGTFIKSTDPTYEQQKLEFEQSLEKPELPVVVRIQYDPSHYIEDSHTVYMSDETITKLQISELFKTMHRDTEFLNYPLEKLEKALKDASA